MNRKTGPFVIMVKPVGSVCNMRCQYCYYINKKNYAVMDEVTLENMIRKYIEAVEGPVISFVWHGGEPTLAGLEFYKKAVYYQKKYLPEGWQCWNNLQTNGYGLNDEWAAFLAEEHFDVGLSIDGLQEVHDFYRHSADGHPTWDVITDNIRLLQNHGVQPDLLCALTSRGAEKPLETYRALKALNTGWMQFIPVIYEGADYSLTPELYGNFLISVFDEWIRKDYPKIGIQFFMEIISVTLGGQPTLCWMSETCGRALIVEGDGSIYSCDHFVDKEHLLGNVNENFFPEVLDSEFQTAFGQNKRKLLPEKCLKCRYRIYCHGACPKDRKQGQPYALCDGLQKFFRHIEPVLNTIYRNSLRARR